MFIEKQKQGKNTKYYLAHSYRHGSKVRKTRKYLGRNLTKRELRKVMPNTTDGIMNTLELINLRTYGVKKLGLFGSFLKGKTHKKSDMDFVVVFEQPNFDNYINLKFLLEKLFKRKIDLVIEKDLKPGFRYVKEEAKYVRL